MKKTYIVNGKVTYPQQGGSLTTFHFISPENGGAFTVPTTENAEADSLDYGDKVNVTIEKIVETEE